MKIQSLSVVVPTERCINDCKFCVSQMRDEAYPNHLDHNKPFYDLYQKDYMKRLEFARDNGCNTVMLTGNGEPQQNRAFLETFGILNSMMERPFRWIEMQTTGTLLDDGYLRFLRNHVGISTISLSLSSFLNDENATICQMKKSVDIKKLCHEIKRYDFNLRLSLNMTKSFEVLAPNLLFSYAKDELKADQITFRVLYMSEFNTPQDKWISENSASEGYVQDIRDYIEIIGTPLGTLEFGATKYSVKGMSTVLDDDCMAQEIKDEYKYLILRPNCKLYSKWDDVASLIF